jgi:hypothetical protein
MVPRDRLHAARVLPHPATGEDAVTTVERAAGICAFDNDVREQATLVDRPAD